MSSDWERDAGSAIALGFAARRNRKVKRRLLEATAGDLAEGEKPRVVSYATRGNAPAIIWWEGGALAILYVVLFTPLGAGFRGILLIGSFCATALWIAHITMSKRWLGVVLTDRRLILFRRAAPPQRLRGVPFDFTAALLEVSPAHVSLQNARQDPFSPAGVAFIVRFDDTVAHGPVKLTFGGFNQADGEAFRDALTGPDSSIPDPIQPDLIQPDLIQPDLIQPSQDPAGGHPDLPGPAEDLLGRRIGAAFIDIALLTGLLVIMGLTVGHSSAGGGGFDISLSPVWSLGYLALVLVYYFTMETTTGQTVGKRLLGLRVLSTDGSRPSAAAIGGRTLLRIVDWLPALYLVGFITVEATGARRQRLGDLAARTSIAPALPARRRALAFVPLALVLLAVAGLSVYRGTSAGGTQADHTPGSPAGTPAAATPPAAVPTLNHFEQAFVAHLRSHYSVAGVADSEIANFGDGVCTGRRAGQSQDVLTSAAASQWSNTSASDAYAMIRLAETDICPAYLPKETWHTVARFTGHGDTSTSRFTVRGNGNWVLKYSYDCSAQPAAIGNFIVDEDAMNDFIPSDEDAMNDFVPSAVAIDRLDSGGKGSWHVYGDAGRHYLKIQTECPYTISVVQKY